MGKTYRGKEKESFAYKRAAAIREYRQLLRNLSGRGETLLAEYAEPWRERATQLKEEYAL